MRTAGTQLSDATLSAAPGDPDTELGALTNDALNGNSSPEEIDETLYDM